TSWFYAPGSRAPSSRTGPASIRARCRDSCGSRRRRWSRPRCAPTTTAAPSASRARSTRPVRCSRARCPPPSPAGSRARSSAASNDDTHHKLGGVDALEAVALRQDVELAALVLAERGDLVALDAELALVGDPAVLLDEAADRAGAVVAVHV